MPALEAAPFLLPASRNFQHSKPPPHRVARLSDERLGRFLVDSVVLPTISTVALVTFLALDPMRCWEEFDSDKVFV